VGFFYLLFYNLIHILYQNTKPGVSGDIFMIVIMICGGILCSKFTTNMHNVYCVSKIDYDKCMTSNPMEKYELNKPNHDHSEQHRPSLLHLCIYCQLCRRAEGEHRGLHYRCSWKFAIVISCDYSHAWLTLVLLESCIEHRFLHTNQFNRLTKCEQVRCFS
jgi:hypothetical protein